MRPNPRVGPENMETDASYFRRRAVEQRKAGMQAVTEAARARHFELAAAYDRRAEAADGSVAASTIR